MEGATYAAAGVDIDAGDEVVRRITSHLASTFRPGVLGGIGDFGGRFELDVSRYRRPVLVSATDGVGTKLAVAEAIGRYDTVGIDLVAMCVDDLVCCGAEPLYLLDYIAVQKIVPDVLESVVAGIAAGCREAKVALIGGETAEHGDTAGGSAIDLAAFAVGVVEFDHQLGADLVNDGDVLIGIASPGLRSNGYTLARHVLLERAGLDLGGPAYDGADVTLADELLRPSVLYSPALVHLFAEIPGAVRACAHITGGGIAGNLIRILPEHLGAIVDRSELPVPRIFDEIARHGSVDDAEMAKVFNLGIGMILVVDATLLGAVLQNLAASGHLAAHIGTVRQGVHTVEVR